MNYADVFGLALERISGSPSTLESPMSVSMLDARDELDSRYAAEERGAREEIAQSFALLRKLPPHLIAVPVVSHKGGGMRATSVSMAEAIKELTSEGYAHLELLAVLQHSVCPLVQGLRDALRDEWVKQQASDLAEARV
jgi:hypothetical protein